MPRIAHHIFEFKIDNTRTRAEVRTSGGKWVADASITPESTGEHGSPDAARLALVGTLRKLADALEKEEYAATHHASSYTDEP